MIQLDPQDLARCAQRIPNELAVLVKSGPGSAMQGGKLIIAGGFIRTVIARERSSDIDVFANHGDVAKNAAHVLALLVSRKEVTTDNAITVLSSPPVQFIHRWAYESPHQLVESFDFSIARAAIWWEGDHWCSMADDRFYVDLAARRLVYMHPRDNTAGGSLLRLQKFIARGYRASPKTLAQIAIALAAAAGAGPDVATAMEILVREIDPRSPEWAGDYQRTDGPTASVPDEIDDERSI